MNIKLKQKKYKFTKRAIRNEGYTDGEVSKSLMLKSFTFEYMNCLLKKDETIKLVKFDTFLDQ